MGSVFAGVFDLSLYASGLAAAVLLALFGWLVSLRQRDLSLADSLWPLFFLLMTICYVGLAETVGTRAILVLFLVALWSVRLSLLITLRNWSRAEDRRYRALRELHAPNFDINSLYQVFGVQAVIAWMISLPLLGAALGSAPVSWLDLSGIMLWMFGFGFEVVADQQLASFRQDPRHADQVLNSGLWRYSRHPNYFGEVCLWWGFGLLAVAAGAWWGLLSAILMTFMLLRVSGVALLEADICARRPAYADYIRRTNALVPGIPKPE